MLRVVIISCIIFYQASTTHNEKTDNLNNSNKVAPRLHTRSSTKTPYHYVGNKNTTLDIPLGDNCRPMQLWLIVRHGTRYPSKSGVRALKYEIQVLAEKINKNRQRVR